MKKILIIGSLNLDTTIETSEIPSPGETVIGRSVSQNAGGKGANQAYAAGKLGGNVSMLGSVGNDTAGKRLIESLQAVGVDTEGIRCCDDTVTGQAFVTVDGDGQNSIIVIPGANGRTTVEYLKERSEYMEGADIIVTQLEIPFETVSYIRDYAVSRGKALIVDPAPAVEGIPDDFWEGIDYIKPNETELAVLSGKGRAAESDICSDAGELIKKGVKNVLVSLGDKGCMLVDSAGTAVFEAISVDAVDTTAAGDTFTGAFAVALSEGLEPAEAVSFAQKAAAIAVTRKGAQPSIPSRQELE